MNNYLDDPEQDKPTFKLDEEDEVAVRFAREILESLLHSNKIKSYNIISIGKGIVALDNLPYATPDAGMIFTLSIRDYDSMRYMDLCITSEKISFGKGGSDYGPQGSDSFSDKVWGITTNGRYNYDSNYNIYELEAAFQNLINDKESYLSIEDDGGEITLMHDEDAY